MFVACISSVLEVLRDVRRGGARDFYISGDLTVELGILCADEWEKPIWKGVCHFLDPMDIVCVHAQHPWSGL